MSTYEGFVASLKKDGKAEVVIQLVSSGIPGASARVNSHVCHCAGDSSTMTIEAVNGVGAGIGDYVMVFRDASHLLKNAAVLLGIPVTGLIIGLFLAVFVTDGFSSHTTTGVIAMAGCLVVGMLIGGLIFRRTSGSNAPIIGKIIEKHREGEPVLKGHRSCPAESTKGCKTCSRPFA